MLNVNFNNKNLKDAMIKVTASLSEKITVSFLGTDNGTYASLSSCDRETQTNIMLECSIPEFRDQKTFTVKSVIKDVVSQLDGDVITLSFGENECICKCGGATIPIEYCEESSMIEPLSIDQAAVMNVKTIDFVSMVRRGGFATTTAPQCAVKGLRNRIAVYFVLDHEKTALRGFSANENLGLMGSYTIHPIDSSKTNESIKKLVDEKKVLLLNYTYLTRICINLEEEYVSIFVWDKQILIKCGNDYYSLLLGNPEGFMYSFKENFDKLMNQDVSWKFTVDEKSFRKAYNLVLLNPSETYEEDRIVAECSLSDESLQISSYSGRNKTVVPVEQISGNYDCCLCIDYVKKLLACCHSKVTFKGNENSQAVIVTDEEDSAAQMLIGRFLTLKQAQEQTQEE